MNMQMSPQPAGVCLPETHVPKPLCLTREGARASATHPPAQRGHMAGQGKTQPADGEGLLGTGEDARRGAGDAYQWAGRKGQSVRGRPTHQGSTLSLDASVPVIHPWGFLVHFTASKILLGFAKSALPTLKNIYIYICHKILETYKNVSRITQKDKYTLRYLKCLTKDLLYI